MKIRIELDTDSDTLYEDRAEALVMLKAEYYKNALEEVWQRCFRPFWKHGFSGELAELTEKDLITHDELTRVIDLIGERYQVICDEVNNDD